jgi:hypothetical protein
VICCGRKIYGAGHAARPFHLRDDIGKTDSAFLKKEIAKAAKVWLHAGREHTKGA